MTAYFRQIATTLFIESVESGRKLMPEVWLNIKYCNEKGINVVKSCCCCLCLIQIRYPHNGRYTWG